MARQVAVRLGAVAMVIAAEALLAGCGAAGPPGPIASPACGTFHLDVRNRSSHPVRVRLDGEETVTLDAGAFESLDGFGSGSAGPWHVEVVDSGSGQVVGSQDITDGVAGTLIEVRDGDAGAPAIGKVTHGTGC